MKKSLLALTLMILVAIGCAPANAGFNGYGNKCSKPCMQFESERAK